MGRRKSPNAELLATWRDRVVRARKVRTDWEREYRVEEGERFFQGKQTSPTEGSRSLVLNHTWATIKAIRPNLFYANPKFFVRPQPGGARIAEDALARQAATAEAVLDAIGQRDQNLKRAGALATLQAFFRIGALKVIYEPKLVPNPNAGQPIMMTTATGEPILGPDQQPMPLRDPRSGQPLTEPEEILTDAAYRYDWVDAANMLLPDQGADPSRWTWLGEEIIVPLESAKEDRRFPAALRAKLKSNTATRRPHSDQPPVQSPDGSGEHDELLRYFEMYDLAGNRVAIWADGQSFEEFLVEGPTPEGIEGHPYALLLGWTPILGPDPLPWPLPHVHSWLPLQREYNVRREQITEGCRRAARKVFYDDTTFPEPEEAKKALESPKDLEAVRINDVNRPPVELKDVPLSGDIFRDIPLLQADWRILTGQTGARLADPDSNTATEATFVERSANLRDTDMQDGINDWLSEAGTKMFQLVQATLTVDLWVKLRGFSDSEFQEYVKRVYGIAPELLTYLPGLREIFRQRFGKEKWVSVTRESLEFQAEISVVPGSSRPRNLDVERAQWLSFLRIIGQFPQIALSRELLRETAGKFEYINERMLDELTALAEKMIQVNATQAGRTQGGENGGQPGGGDFLSSLAGALTAGRQ